MKPVRIWLSEEYTRAAPGGTGAAKTGGNYASSLLAQAEAIENGCDQVAFLDAVEKKWVEELGGMNLYFVLDDNSVVTPELSGTILEGVTRDSILKLVTDLGHTGHRAQDLDRRVARRCRVRPDPRGVRLRYRRGDHAGRVPEVERTARSRSPTARAARSPPPSAAPCSTCSTAAPPTRTAG